jgi:hypothetical protein
VTAASALSGTAVWRWTTGSGPVSFAGIPPMRSSGMARRRGCTVMRTWRTSDRAIFQASESLSAKRSATQFAENSVGRNRSSVPVSLQKDPT